MSGHNQNARPRSLYNANQEGPVFVCHALVLLSASGAILIRRPGHLSFDEMSAAADFECVSKLNGVFPLFFGKAGKLL